MNEADAIELTMNLVSKTRAVDASLLSPTTDLVEDLGFDSLDATELLSALHMATGCEVPVEDVSQLTTIRSIAELLLNAQAPK
jgi:acyl carrier protein